VLADARAVLPSVVPSGEFDHDAFDEVLGAVVRLASATGAPVSAFGEPVDLLFEEGKIGASMALESAWIVLAEELRFSQLCACRSGPPSTCPTGPQSYADVCRVHSDVLEGVPLPSSVDRSSCTFALGPGAPAQARGFVASVLTEWGLDHLVARGTLVASELATNAVVHSHSGFSVSLHRSTASAVTIWVGDRSQVAPRPEVPSSWTAGGCGSPSSRRSLAPGVMQRSRGASWYGRPSTRRSGLPWRSPELSCGAVSDGERHRNAHRWGECSVPVCEADSVAGQGVGA
jgi:hypothetical protein